MVTKKQYESAMDTFFMKKATVGRLESYVNGIESVIYFSKENKNIKGSSRQLIDSLNVDAEKLRDKAKKNLERAKQDMQKAQAKLREMEKKM